MDAINILDAATAPTVGVLAAALLYMARSLWKAIHHISTQVDNHIPAQIKAVQDSLDKHISLHHDIPHFARSLPPPDPPISPC